MDGNRLATTPSFLTIPDVPMVCHHSFRHVRADGGFRSDRPCQGDRHGQDCYTAAFFPQLSFFVIVRQKTITISTGCPEQLVFLNFWGHNVLSMAWNGTMEHLVVGDQWAAPARYHRLCSRCEEGRLGLLVPRLLERDDLRPPGGETALVFREMAFHPLTENMIRSPWERSFLAPARVGSEGAFWEDGPFVEGLLRRQAEGAPVQVEREACGGYRIRCDNGSSVTCHHLHWMLDPRAFVELFSGENSPPPCQGRCPRLLARALLFRGDADGQERNSLFSPLLHPCLRTLYRGFSDSRGGAAGGRVCDVFGCG